LGAVSTLASLGDRDHGEALTARLEDEDQSVRRAALEAVFMLRLPEAGPRLLKILRSADGDAHLRAGCPGALSLIGDREGIPDLIKISGNPKEEVELRTFAVAALGTLRAAPATPLLASLVADGALEASIREVACRALARVAPEKAPKILLERLDDDKEDLDVRIGAADGLGFLRSRDALPTLLRLVRGPEVNEAERYIRPLAALRLPESRTELLRLIRENKGTLRLYCARLLGDVGIGEAADPLLRLLHDADPSLRAAAAVALCRSGRKEGVPVLFEAASADPRLAMLGSLNAIRRPELWAAVRDRTFPEGVAISGEFAQVLGAFTGVDIDLSEFPEPWPGFEFHFGVGEVTGLEELERDDREFVLEPGKARLLSSGKALEFWKSWAAEALK
jgi:HEAT repeat protein